MLNNFSSKVGAKIRTYRKAQNLSLEELSARINKSKGTISKYESGAIAVDVTTLYEISIALHIDITKLVEHFDETAISSSSTSCSVNLPPLLYLYHTHHLKYYTSLLYLSTNEDKDKTTATLYYKALNGPGDYIKCTNIYHGELYYSDTNFNFIFTNFHNQRDMVYMLFFVPIHISESYQGLCLGMQNTNMRPACFRTLLSTKPLTKNYLEKHLLLSRAYYRKLKTGSYYSIEEQGE